MAEIVIPEKYRGATFESVWAALMDVAEQQKETARQLQETKQLMKENAEQQKKYAEQQKEENAEQQRKYAEQQKEENAEQQRKYAEREAERQKEAAEYKKRQKKLDQQMGFVTNRFGELAEHLVAPNIHSRFNEMGHFFSEAAPGGHRIFDENGKTQTEIDLLLENGDTIMAVEVKAKPLVKDVEHHIKRLEILRDCRRKKNDRRKIHGAIAGAIFGTAEKKATADAGLYVIEQSGDTMKIEIPAGFVAQEW